MIKILSDDDALRCHHSTIWIKRSETGEAEIITTLAPADVEICDYEKLKVRYDHSEFESTLLACANSGLSVEEFLNTATLSIMNRHRTKKIAREHLSLSVTVE